MDIATQQDVSAALADLIGSMLAEASTIRPIFKRLSPLEIEYADGWAHGDERTEAGPAALAINAIHQRMPSARMGADSAKWLAELRRLQAVTPGTIADCLRGMSPKAIEDAGFSVLDADAIDKLAAHLRKIQRTEEAPRLGELCELVKAAAHAEPVDNAIDLRHWRREIDDGHGLCVDGSGDMAATEPVDSCRNVSMALLAPGTTRATPYIVEGVLAEGQPCLTLGHEKDGKTSLGGMDLAVSIATGTPYLGYFDVPAKRRVLLLSGESGEATLIDSFQRVCRARGIEPAGVEGFEFSTWLPQFASANDLAELDRRLTDSRPDLLTVDPAGVCMSPGAASMLSVAYGELRAVAEICKRHGTTLNLIHHATKGSNIGRLGLRAAAGAGFAEFARQWIFFDRIGQFKPATGEHRLRLTTGGSAGHAGRWNVDWREGNQSDPGGRVWDLSVRPAESKRTGDDGGGKLEAAVKVIASAMKSYTDYESGRTIRAAAGVNTRRFPPAIARMVDDGIVVEREITKGGQQCRGYKLAAKSDTAA